MKFRRVITFLLAMVMIFSCSQEALIHAIAYEDPGQHQEQTGTEPSETVPPTEPAPQDTEPADPTGEESTLPPETTPPTEGTEPTEAVTEPTEPVTEPTEEPTVPPTETATEPTEQVVEPTEEPTVPPTEPATEPTEPATESTEPVAEPTAPGVSIGILPETHIVVTIEVYNADQTTVMSTQLASLDDLIRDPGVPSGEHQQFTGTWEAWSSGAEVTVPAFGEKMTAGYLEQFGDGAVIEVKPVMRDLAYVQFWNENGNAVVYTVSGVVGTSVNYSNIPFEPADSNQQLTGWRAADGTEYGLSGAVTLGAEKGSVIKLTPMLEERHWITFDSQGGSLVQPQSYMAGDTTKEPAEPTKTGYTFLGWYDQAEGGNEFHFGNKLPEDVMLYAHWEANRDTTYTVVFWKQSVSDKYDAADKDKTYDFWFSSKQNGQTGDTTAWNNGNGRNRISSLIGETYTGFHFGRIVNAEIKPDGSTVVNVYYDRDQAQITFHWDEYVPGGFFGLGGEWEHHADTWYGLYGQTFSQAGYTWDSTYRWTSRSYIGTTMTVLDAFLPATDAWNSNDNTHTLDLYRNEPYGSDWIYHYLEKPDGTYELKVSVKTSGRWNVNNKFEGYTAAYWSNDEGSVSNSDYRKAMNIGDSVAPGDSGNLYIFHTLNSYTLYYYTVDLNGTTGKVSSQDLKYTAILPKIEDPAKPTNIPRYYEFKGWFYDPTGQDPVEWGTDAMPTNNLAVYAVWQGKDVEVTFDLNGGTGTTPAPQKVHAGDKATEPNVEFTKPGYKFGGWVTEEGQPFNFNTAITEDTVLKAKWISTAKNVQVIYNAGIGSEAPRDDSFYAVGATARVLRGAKAPEGMTFMYWELNGEPYKPGDVFIIEDDLISHGAGDSGTVTLTAHYENAKDDTTTVIYHSNYPKSTGMLDKVETDYDVPVNGKYPLRKDVFDAPLGYTFDGWATSELAEKAGIPSNTIRANADGENHVYAVWSPRSFEVTITYTDEAGNTLKPSVPFDVKPEVDWSPSTNPWHWDVSGEIPNDLTGNDGKHYVFDHSYGDVKGEGYQWGGVKVQAVYTLDEKGTDPDNPGKPGDGVPDKYQVEVTYKVENGTWSDGTDTARTEVVTLLDAYGKPSEGGIATLEKVPEGMQADTGYNGGAWTPATPKTVTKDGDKEFTYSFVEDHTKTKTLTYYVQYYKDGEPVGDPEQFTENVWVNDPDTLAIQEEIDTSSDKYVGYKLDHTDPSEVPAKDSLVDDKTVISVYYVKDESQTKEVKYTVKYYQDGAEVSTQDYTDEVWVNDPDTLAIQEEIDTSSDKYVGYKLDHTDPSEVPAKDSLVDDKTVISVYYVKDSFGYTVNYYYDGVKAEGETETGTLEFESKIPYNDNSPKEYNGHHYILESVTNENGTITSDSSKNVVEVYYVIDEKGTGDIPDGTADKYQVTVNYVAEPAEGGSVSKTSEVLTIPGDKQTSGTVKASANSAPAENFAFDGWTADNDIIIDNPNSEALSQSFTAVGGETYTFTAHFSEDKIGPDGGPDKVPDKYQVTIVFANDGNGTTTPSGSDVWTLGTKGNYLKEANLMISGQATPNSGFAFDYWDYDGDMLPNGASLLMNIEAKGGETYTFTAHFSKDTIGGDTDPTDPDPTEPDPGDGTPDKYQVKVSYASAGNGTVAPEGSEITTFADNAESGTVNANSTATAAEGYTFDYWDLNGEKIDSGAVLEQSFESEGDNVYVYTAHFAIDANNDDIPDYEQNLIIYVAGHTANYVFDGTPKTAEGFDVTSATVDGKEAAKDIVTVTTDAAFIERTAQGVYPMGLTSEKFDVSENKFASVTIVVTDGSLTIAPQSIDPNDPEIPGPTDPEDPDEPEPPIDPEQPYYGGVTVGTLPDVVYNGLPQPQGPVVTDKNDNVLVEGTDYELSYSRDTTNVGTVTVTVTGTGNYTGSFDVTYHITPKDATITVGSFTKTQGEDDPEFTALVDGLIEGDEEAFQNGYELTREEGETPDSYTIYADPVPAGNMRITDRDHFQLGNYSVTVVTGTLTINAPDEPVTPPETPDEPVTPPETPDEPVTPPETPDEPETPPETPDDPETPPEIPDDPVTPPDVPADPEPAEPPVEPIDVPDAPDEPPVVPDEPAPENPPENPPEDQPETPPENPPENQPETPPENPPEDQPEPPVIIDEEDTPLAENPFEDEYCCILHMLIMILAFAVTVYYTHDKKRRQAKEFETREELLKSTFGKDERSL